MMKYGTVIDKTSKFTAQVDGESSKINDADRELGEFILNTRNKSL